LWSSNPNWDVFRKVGKTCQCWSLGRYMGYFSDCYIWTNRNGKASVKLFFAHLPQGGSLLPCGLYSSGHLKGNGCDLIWYYPRIFLEGLKRTMTNPCNAASLQADVWIQNIQYLKQRSAFAFHTLLCVTRRCQTVYSLCLYCHFMAIASMPKNQKQLKHVCLVMNWNKSHLHCHTCWLY